MLTPVYTTQFKRDVKRAVQRGYNLEKLKKVINSLLFCKSSLPYKYKNHALIGKFNLHRELHIEPDWILIYLISENECYFVRTGTHSDLFSK